METWRRSREALIKCLATACTADLPQSFGKNPQNTTSIPALFACTMQQIPSVQSATSINQCFPRETLL
jgi:hypothetical protein